MWSREFINKNPSYQISFYMRHAGTEWGILTNGRLWRLYHEDTAHKLDRFYEVDLPALVETGDQEDFLYFFAFFRRSAFDDGPLGVRALLAESADYARSVGDSLKGQVYEALRHLAQGFLDHPRNGLGTDPATLREVYDNSLIVLYRLLFVLYTESRDLLPVRGSEMYREAYSLYVIKRDVAGGPPPAADERDAVAEAAGAVRDHKRRQRTPLGGDLQRRPLRPRPAPLPGGARRG